VSHDGLEITFEYIPNPRTDNLDQLFEDIDEDLSLLLQQFIETFRNISVEIRIPIRLVDDLNDRYIETFLSHPLYLIYHESDIEEFLVSSYEMILLQLEHYNETGKYYKFMFSSNK